jgi:HSP20 family molecular chaperone IbpA
MSLANKHTGENSTLNGFFYQPWLLKELTDQRHLPFAPEIFTEEDIDAYHITIQLLEVQRKHCSIEIELPFLFIRIQQKEMRGNLFDFIRLQPILHIFARHFLLPHNVDMESISFSCTDAGLMILLPKYYPD